MIFVIAYDLKNADGEDYENLISAIDALYSSRYVHLEESVWLVGYKLTVAHMFSPPNARGIKNLLSRYVKEGDSLFVSKIDPGDTTYYGRSNEINQFLEQFRN